MKFNVRFAHTGQRLSRSIMFYWGTMNRGLNSVMIMEDSLGVNSYA